MTTITKSKRHSVDTPTPSNTGMAWHTYFFFFFQSGMELLDASLCMDGSVPSLFLKKGEEAIQRTGRDRRRQGERAEYTRTEDEVAKVSWKWKGEEDA